MSKKETAGLIIIGILVIAVAVLGWRVAAARWDRQVAEANLRAMQDTVRIFRGEAEDATSRETVAASRFQAQREIDSDSIRSLNTALGSAARELNLRQRALTDAQVEFDRVQASLDQALVELNAVRSPSGRNERVAAFQEENDLVQADLVVTVPRDTAQGIEVEMVTTVKPFNLTYSLACTDANDAVATFQAPAGITARPQMGTVSPEICFGERPSLGAGFKLSFGNLFLGALVGGVVGLLLGTSVF